MTLASLRSCVCSCNSIECLRFILGVEREEVARHALHSVGQRLLELDAQVSTEDVLVQLEVAIIAETISKSMFRTISMHDTFPRQTALSLSIQSRKISICCKKLKLIIIARCTKLVKYSYHFGDRSTL